METSKEAPRQLTKVEAISVHLETHKAEIIKAMPTWLSNQPEREAQRIVQGARLAVARDEKLIKCEPKSILLAVVDLASIGLEAGGPSGEAYLVPFWDKHTNSFKCQPLPGYKGLVKLAHQSAKLKDLDAETVCKSDHFVAEKGDTPKLEHKPDWFGDRSDEAVIGCYAIAHLTTGGVQFVVLNRAQVEKIRARAKAGEFGPWATDFGEMAKKTAIRRLYKLLPRSAEMNSAVNMVDAVDTDDANTVGEFVDAQTGEPVKALAELTDELKKEGAQ